MKIDNSTLSVIAVRTSQYPDDNKPEFYLSEEVMSVKAVL